MTPPRPPTGKLIRALRGPAPEAAAALLGSLIVSDSTDGLVAIRLTEVEGYAGVGEDPGSHAHRGRTPRNASMFGPPGTAYVYFTYGMHWCLNVATGPQGLASAVLLRAGQVIDGVDLARARRKGAADRDLARGPARLTQALGVTRELDGADLLNPHSSLRLERSRTRATQVVRQGPRVGVSGEGALTPWRFWLDGEPTVSLYRASVRN